MSASTSCKRSAPPAPVVVHVVRELSFAAELLPTDVEFRRTLPAVRSGRPVIVETRDDVRYIDLAKRLKAFMPDVLILYSRDFVPDDPATKRELGGAELVCGLRPAFIPASVSGEQREAAEMYLRFLVSHCPKPTQVTAVAETSNVASPQAESEKDPQRPPCTSARCEAIKKFLKDHYCGESPFGNGPDDGCDLRVEKKPVATSKVAAHYECKWNEAESKSQCQQHGQPSPEFRDILLRELRRLGLTAKAEKDVHYTVLQSTSGWSLLTGDYGEVAGTDLTLCEVTVAVEQSGQKHVLREVPIKKTDADVPEVTTWSPVDIADVDGDGHLEIVLEGDAYENHWFEVVALEGGSFETIFSGLGYYL